MKAADVVAKLAILLPQVTAFFTKNVDALSVTRSGTVVTVQCAEDHELEVGNAVAIAGAVTQIGTSSLTRVAGTTPSIGTIVTDADHDLTNKTSPTITISGATEAEFNGTFVRTNIDNRRTITFEMPDSGATTATGSPILENAESQLRQYDGTYQVVEVPTPSSFTVVNSATTMLDPIGAIKVRGKPRISAGVNPARMFDAYTEQNVSDYWMFVWLEDVLASKSRSVRSDAIDNLRPGDNFRQQVIQPFSIVVFIPSQDDLGGADARDQVEDMFRPICQSVLGAKFSSGLHAGNQGAVQFVTHGTFQSDTAVYAHAFSFQQVVDLYEEDTVGPDLDVAFRNLDFEMFPELPGDVETADRPSLTATLDLDDTPL